MSHLINIGCGRVYHLDWRNYDLWPVEKSIRHLDIRYGLPVQDNVADMVYSSHLLEHLSALEANSFLQDCLRVLKPGGIIRIVVPDLEGIAKAYIQSLLDHDHGKAEASANRKWMVLELYDQVWRTTSGGEMKMYLQRDHIENLDFVLARTGQEGIGLLGTISKETGYKTWWQRLRDKPPSWYIEQMRRQLSLGFIFLVGGSAYRNQFQQALFRNSGEIHRQMYDRVSLAEILIQVGFRQPQQMEATESRLPGFARYELDSRNGIARKPDSLYMEALK